MKNAKPKYKGWGAKSLALLIGIVFWVAVLELGVRIFVEESILPRFVIDSGYGVRANQPNVVTRHYSPRDYDVIVSTNSAGMRGTREYEMEKPDGVYRILVLGDSMVFGFGAEDDEVLSAVLEDLLNEGPAADRRYEVLNFSVSGFGHAELLVTYREMARQYDPDAVVLFYYDNDVGNNVVSQLFEVVDEDSVRRTENEYLPGVRAREILYAVPPIRWLFEHSQAWNFVRNRASSVVQNSLLKKQGLKTFSSNNPEALELTSALLRQFITDIQSDGAESVLVIIPIRRGLTSNIPLTIQAIEGTGTKVVDAREFLEVEDYFVFDTHIRPSGHQKIAEQLEPLFE